MGEPLSVDVVFDFVCPWCYIGKRRLEAALKEWTAKHPDDPKPAVRWLPFQLTSDIPEGGISRRQYLEQKHGSSGPDLEKQNQIAALARRLGLEFDLDKLSVQPNTIDAHRLSGCAQRRGWQDAMVEALLRAYFMEGVNLNDHDALAGLAAKVGFDWGQVTLYLASSTDVTAVEKLEFQARNSGIDIVPFYVFNDHVTVSGAHEIKVLLEAMEKASTVKAVPLSE